MSSMIHEAVREVAADIYQVRLPLPFALNHVNCYLLRDGDGWTILDTGLNRPEIHAGWQAAFATLGIAPAQVTRIVVTHMHPDHIGLAGRLQQETGAAVFMSPREWEIATIAWVENREQGEYLAGYLRQAGAPADVGAIVEIHELINRLADEGKAVVVISSYLPEIMALSDRVLVSRMGKVVEEYSAFEATEEKLMYAAIH